MRRVALVAGITAVIIMLGSQCFADEKTKRGGPPRPAEKPPEYGCVLRDLKTTPNAVPDEERIDTFLLKYQCKEKTRPVDIEIWSEQTPGGGQELVKVATDVVLEKGEHTLHLSGGGLAHGGRYITILKADAPAGKKDVTRRVDTAVCKGWRIKYVEKHLNVSGCEINLHTDPDVFKTGERIDKFILKTNCKKKHVNKDIKISWEPLRGEHKEAQKELVKVATDATLPEGPTTLNLMGGGVGREGYYILEIDGVTLGSYFKTNCTAWTLSDK